MLRRIMRNLWRRGIGSCVSQFKRELAGLEFRFESRKAIELNLRLFPQTFQASSRCFATKTRTTFISYS